MLGSGKNKYFFSFLATFLWRNIWLSLFRSFIHTKCDPFHCSVYSLYSCRYIWDFLFQNIANCLLDPQAYINQIILITKHFIEVSKKFIRNRAWVLCMCVNVSFVNWFQFQMVLFAVFPQLINEKSFIYRIRLQKLATLN